MTTAATPVSATPDPHPPCGDPRYVGGFLNYAEIRISRLASVHGRELEVFRCGSGAPLLLLPGYSLATVWRSQFAELSKEFEVIAIHYPGGGNSESHPDCNSLDELVRVVASVVEALELDQAPHVVGWSMGGFLAIVMAARHPELVRSLVLVNSVASIKHRTIPFADVAEDFMRNWIRRGDEWPGFSYDHVKDSKGLRPMRAQYDNLIDVRHLLPDIVAPTTVVSGRADPVRAEGGGDGDAIADSVKHGRSVSLDDAGHFIPLFHEAAFHDVLRQHLANA